MYIHTFFDYYGRWIDCGGGGMVKKTDFIENI